MKMGRGGVGWGGVRQRLKRYYRKSYTPELAPRWNCLTFNYHRCKYCYITFELLSNDTYIYILSSRFHGRRGKKEKKRREEKKGKNGNDNRVASRDAMLSLSFPLHVAISESASIRAAISKKKCYELICQLLWPELRPKPRSENLDGV